MVELKFCVAMVLFDPDWPSLCARLESLLEVCPKLILMDNTPTTNANSIPSAEVRQFLQTDRIQYQHLGSNLGICVAYNRAAQIAQSEGYQWMFTLDQDTLADADFIKSMLESSEAYEASTAYTANDVNVNFKDVGLFAPRLHLGDGLFQGQSADEHSAVPNYSEVEVVMSSGCLLSLKVFLTLNGFDEDFWLDGFDHEYCFHLKSAEFKRIMCEDVLLTHSLGATTKESRFFMRGHRHISNHSAWRRRLIARNRRLLWSKYPSEVQWIQTEKHQEKKEFFETLILEKSGLKKVWSILMGMRDFHQGRRGSPHFLEKGLD
jgi:rhamnosyltransferase